MLKSILLLSLSLFSISKSYTLLIGDSHAEYYLQFIDTPKNNVKEYIPNTRGFFTNTESLNVRTYCKTSTNNYCLSKFHQDFPDIINIGITGTRAEDWIKLINQKKIYFFNTDVYLNILNNKNKFDNIILHLGGNDLRTRLVWMMSLDYVCMKATN
jgi:hypothetical protein